MNDEIDITKQFNNSVKLVKMQNKNMNKHYITDDETLQYQLRTNLQVSRSKYQIQTDSLSLPPSTDYNFDGQSLLRAMERESVAQEQTDRHGNNLFNSAGIRLHPEYARKLYQTCNSLQSILSSYFIKGRIHGDSMDFDIFVQIGKEFNQLLLFYREDVSKINADKEFRLRFTVQLVNIQTTLSKIVVELDYEIKNNADAIKYDKMQKNGFTLEYLRNVVYNMNKTVSHMIEGKEIKDYGPVDQEMVNLESSGLSRYIIQPPSEPKIPSYGDVKEANEDDDYEAKAQEVYETLESEHDAHMEHEYKKLDDNGKSDAENASEVRKIILKKLDELQEDLSYEETEDNPDIMLLEAYHTLISKYGTILNETLLKENEDDDFDELSASDQYLAIIMEEINKHDPEDTESFQQITEMIYSRCTKVLEKRISKNTNHAHAVVFDNEYEFLIKFLEIRIELESDRTAPNKFIIEILQFLANKFKTDLESFLIEMSGEVDEDEGVEESKEDNDNIFMKYSLSKLKQMKRGDLRSIFITKHTIPPDVKCF